MVEGVDIQELRKVSKDRGMPLEKLLEERALSHEGELIGALIRYYEKNACDAPSVHYALRKTICAGFITSELKFLVEGPPNGVFISGVRKLHSLEIDSFFDRDFKNEGNAFGNIWIGRRDLLYSMDKPPEIPRDSYGGGCFGGLSSAPTTKEPRLELYLGNQQTIPFLQANLEGWRYLQLTNLLGDDLPVSESVREKIEDEQLKIFDAFTEHEKALRLSTEANDSFGEGLRHDINNTRVLRILKTAIQRGYHETGVQVERQLDPGVVMRIDMRKFFAGKKEKYQL